MGKGLRGLLDQEAVELTNEKAISEMKGEFLKKNKVLWLKALLNLRKPSIG